MVREVVEVQLETIALGRNELAHLRDQRGFSVGRETHHLVFVAILREAQIQRERVVKKSERMRIMDAEKRRDLIPFSRCEHRAHEVAHSIDGKNRSAIKG